MQASTVKIDPRLLNSRPLTPQRKKELRRQIVIDLIKSRPNGERITLSEIQHACNYKGTGEPVPLIKGMIKDGLITKHENGPRDIYYTVNDAKTIVTAKPALDTAEPIEEVPAKPALTNEARAVRSLVLEYFWNKQNDSLREFVKWIENGGTEKI